MGGFEGGASGGITWKVSLLSKVENIHRMVDLKLHRHNYKPVEQISSTCCSNTFDSFLVLISVKPKPLSSWSLIILNTTAKVQEGNFVLL